MNNEEKATCPRCGVRMLSFLLNGPYHGENGVCLRDKELGFMAQLAVVEVEVQSLLRLSANLDLAWSQTPPLVTRDALNRLHEIRCKLSKIDFDVWAEPATKARREKLMKTGMGIHQPKTQFAVDYKTSMTGPWYRLPMTYDGFFDAERHCKRWTYQTGGYPARVVSIDENGHETKRKPVTVSEDEKPALMAEINKCAAEIEKFVYDPSKREARKL